MKILENRVPPPLVGLVFLILIKLLAGVDNLLHLPDSARTGLGILFLSLGLLVATLALLHFRKAETTIDPLHPGRASKLVVSGVFGFTRNPMYLGLVLVTLAAALYMSSLLSLGLVAGFAWYLQRFQITPEERVLGEMFGEQYQRYTDRVRRWL